MGYIVTATWTAEPGQEALVREAITKLLEPSRNEPGNRFYQPYEDPETPGVFRFFEIYDDEEAYLAHGSSEHFTEWGHGVAIPALVTRERAFYKTIDS